MAAALDVKKILLKLAEQDAKVLLQELVGPLLVQELEAKIPGAAAIAQPLIDELVAQGLKLADQIDGEVGN